MLLEAPMVVTGFPFISEGISTISLVPLYFVIVTLPLEVVYSHSAAAVVTLSSEAKTAGNAEIINATTKAIENIFFIKFIPFKFEFCY